MFQGTRTITQVMHTNSLGAAPTPIHITYDDGSSEQYVPYNQGVYQNIQCGMVEEFDALGNRTGFGWPNQMTPKWQVFPQPFIPPIGPLGPMPSFPSVQSTLEDMMTNRTDIGSLLKRLGVDLSPVNYLPDTCSKCGTENSTIVFIYHAFGIKRCICNVCATEVMDKFFGVSNNAKAEKVLYDDKK